MNKEWNNDDDPITAENDEQVSDHDIDQSFFKLKRDKLERFRIRKLTWTVSELVSKYRNNILNLKPDYQRNIVWDLKKQTQFIESLLLGIITPPIYLAENRRSSATVESDYEVVDGQQRLSSILSFLGAFEQKKVMINNRKLPPLKLEGHGLEYYRDMLSGFTYQQLQAQYESLFVQLIENSIDIYIIGSETPPEVKYDIFARLNRGSEKLTEAELRRAIYRSPTTMLVDQLMEKFRFENSKLYKSAFSPLATKRYVDINRIFKTIAYYKRFNSSTFVIEGYNSRPKEMINDVLQELQNQTDESIISQLPSLVSFSIHSTAILKKMSIDNAKISELKVLSIETYIDSLAPFIALISDYELDNLWSAINSDSAYRSTFATSSSTTSRVNDRCRELVRIIANYAGS